MLKSPYFHDTNVPPKVADWSTQFLLKSVQGAGDRYTPPGAALTAPLDQTCSPLAGGADLAALRLLWADAAVIVAWA